MTINIADVDEAPEITSGDATISYAETDTGALGTYQASDPERATIVWSLGGTDDSAFAISSGGVLTFQSQPDYESAADIGGNNEYNVTVQASDGGTMIDMLEVTVRVTNVDEPGAITLSPLQPQHKEHC